VLCREDRGLNRNEDVLKLPGLAVEREHLLLRFLRSALGFWRGRTAYRAWMLVAVMIAAVLLQLFVQYRLNLWSRDFFNAIEQKDKIAVLSEALKFAPLAATSLVLALVSVWSRMTTEREWRRWLSDHLYDYWLCNDCHLELKFMHGDHQTPEYRIAEDGRVATDLPIDLGLGLLSSLLTVLAFIGVLWSVGGSLGIEIFGLKLTIPGYLVFAVAGYSLLLTSATLIVSRRLTDVVEANKGAEAELRACGAHLRAIGESSAAAKGAHDGRRAMAAALDQVIERWRALCWQILRMTLVSHTNLMFVPSLGLLLCAPKYLAGAMTLGSVVQAGAAFVAVQGAFTWAADNYGRLAEWTASASRVASLLCSLDQINGGPSQIESYSTDGELGYSRMVGVTQLGHNVPT
jgi:vitamin B12/bleomycin/antimicrobial peptide transport system ATP-binding/permease protein